MKLSKIFLVSLVITTGLLLGTIKYVHADYLVPADIGTPVARWTFDGPYWLAAGNGVYNTGGTSGYDLIALGPFINESDENASKFGTSLNESGGSLQSEFYTRADFDTAYTNTFSFSTWMYFDVLPISDYTLIGMGEDASPDYGWRVRYTASNSKFVFQSSADGTTEWATVATSGATLAADTWYNIIVTYDSATNLVTMYLNNSQTATATAVGGIYKPATPLYIFGNIGTDETLIIIDDTAFYATVLTSDQRTNLYGMALPTITDYNNQIPVTILNGSATTYTDKQIGAQVPFAQYITNGYLSATLKEVIAQASGNTHLHGFFITSAHSVTDLASVFVTLGTVFPSTTTTYNIYGGIDTPATLTLKEQGFPFSGADDLITVPDSVSLDVPNNFSISVNAEILNNPSAGTAWLVNKWVANTGYSFGINSTGNFVVRLDGNTYTTTSARSTDLDSFGIFKQADTLYVYEGSTLVQGFSVTAATPTANAEVLEIGENLDAVVYSVQIRDETSVPSSNINNLLWYEFEIAEVSILNVGTVGNGWAWDGALTDSSSQANNGTWVIVADETNLTVTAQPIVFISSAESPSISESIINVLGTVPSLFPTATANPNFPFTNIVQVAATSLEIEWSSVAFVLIYAFGVVFAVISTKGLSSPFIGILILNFVILGGALSNFYSVWMAALTIPLITGSYAIDQLRRLGLT